MGQRFRERGETGRGGCKGSPGGFVVFQGGHRPKEEAGFVIFGMSYELTANLYNFKFSQWVSGYHCEYRFLVDSIL